MPELSARTFIKKQRIYRKFRKNIASLTRNTEEHCLEVCMQQWHKLCNAINCEMHIRKVWNILRQLLDEPKKKLQPRD
ncbi:hypothetical protein HPB48_017572 [Haemaphysalis longicornis]|uniref:Uncharacterized protein n=1 Tax=Haemaphysalis longicornis TaxID=44386 RepID=A0A9J6GVP8_HAELO|nr:hypothetical protein HPB48_017572 [Haemaphysalis longicornis]